MASNYDTLSTSVFSPHDLNLTCQGLKVVNWDCTDDEFEFVFGNNVCRLHSVIAEFLSPKIARLRRNDPLTSSYAFQNPEFFDLVQRLVSSVRLGKTFHVQRSDFVALLRLSHELENIELLNSLIGPINTETLSLDDAILLLQAGIHLGTAFSGRFGNLREFVAKHFYQIKKPVLDELDLETSQLLLSSPSLRIQDEDSLYDFVRSRSENDLSFTSLFEFICFEYLSTDRAENFASFVYDGHIGQMSPGIWRCVAKRFIHETGNIHNPRCFKTEFLYNESRPLDGIIAHLTRKCGGNVHEHGVVNVETNSWFTRPGNETTWHPKHTVDLGTNSFYCSENVHSWVSYDFGERGIIPRSYSLRSRVDGYHQLKSWVIEVSNDGASWTEIDKHVDSNALKAGGVTQNFNIPNVPNSRIRFFRIRQIGPSSSNDNHTSFSALEIFGTLFNA